MTAFIGGVDPVCFDRCRVHAIISNFAAKTGKTGKVPADADRRFGQRVAARR